MYAHPSLCASRAQFLAAKDKTFTPPSTPDAMRGPTLKRNVASLARLGYRSYFAGVVARHGGEPVFVPLDGDYWDDAMELCRDPGQGQRICWHDILSTVAGGHTDRAIRAAPNPARWRHSVAICAE